jgi:hypothetical protein
LNEACTAGEQRACVGAGHLLVRHEPRSAAYGQALAARGRSCQTIDGEAAALAGLVSIIEGIAP